MADKTGIEWTDATWNPVRGCTKISPECKHCYAETFAERFRGVPGHPYELGFDLRTVPDKLNQPLRWQRARRIFVNSMSDLFHEGVGDEYVARVFAVMQLAQHHTFQVLTKRAERLPHWFAWLASDAGRAAWLRAVAGAPDGGLESWSTAWPFRNVWLGVSVEDRKYGLPRIEHLRNTPAAVRFLSIEPLLEDLGTLDLTGIHWVIVGGESGHGARPFNLAWARDIQAQCKAAGVTFFMKQVGPRPFERVPMLGGGHQGKDLLAEMAAGARRPFDGWTTVVTGTERFLQRHPKVKHPKGGDMAEWPEDLRVQEFPEVRP